MSEWISVKERPPSESGVYLTSRHGILTVLNYSAKHRAFNAFDDTSRKSVAAYRIKVTHWMPLPELPKEEETCQE